MSCISRNSANNLLSQSINWSVNPIEAGTGVFACVGWQVTLSDPISQATPCIVSRWISIKNLPGLFTNCTSYDIQWRESWPRDITVLDPSTLDSSDVTLCLLVKLPLRRFTVESGNASPCIAQHAETLMFRERTRLQVGNRAFSDNGPVAWNNLSTHGQTSETLTVFKSRLKTQLIWCILHSLNCMYCSCFISVVFSRAYYCSRPIRSHINVFSDLAALHLKDFLPAIVLSSLAYYRLFHYPMTV